LVQLNFKKIALKRLRWTRDVSKCAQKKTKKNVNDKVQNGKKKARDSDGRKARRKIPRKVT